MFEVCLMVRVLPSFWPEVLEISVFLFKLTVVHSVLAGGRDHLSYDIFENL